MALTHLGRGASPTGNISLENKQNLNTWGEVQVLTDGGRIDSITIRDIMFAEVLNMPAISRDFTKLSH